MQAQTEPTIVALFNEQQNSRDLLDIKKGIELQATLAQRQLNRDKSSDDYTWKAPFHG